MLFTKILTEDERFRIQVRTKWHESVEQMQKDLDDCLKTYNYTPPHQGRNMNGRTPHKVLIAGQPKPGKTA